MPSGYSMVSHKGEPAVSARPVTLSDTADMPRVNGFLPRALYVGATGNLRVLLENDTNPVDLLNVPVGVLPISFRRVYSTGTTVSASNLIAFY